MSNELKLTQTELDKALGIPPISGAAVDELGKLFESAAFNGTSENGTAIVIGRNPNRNAEITAFVQTPETTEGVLTISTYITLDGTNYTFLVNTIQIGNDTVGFAGVVTGKCSWPVVAWEKYAPANIKLRTTVVDGDNDGASAWGKVAVFVGFGEETIYGRARGVADDIIGD